jgi:outer membrane immunogenic protein
LAGAAAFIICSGAAQAADIVEPTAYDWTGPYIGLQGGYAWGDNDVNFDPISQPALTALVDSDPVILFPPEDGSIGIDGWVGGLHAGYLWQHDSLVLGIEGDGEFADIDGDTDVLVSEGGARIAKLEQEIDWLASLRLRAGFAMDRALIYATGGLAVGGVEFSIDSNETGDSESENETEWGWTIGGGLEYAFTDDLSARIEYRYTDLGDISLDEFERVGDTEVDTTFHAVRVGLSWHFGNI